MHVHLHAKWGLVHSGYEIIPKNRANPRRSVNIFIHSFRRAGVEAFLSDFLRGRAKMLGLWLLLLFPLPAAAANGQSVSSGGLDWTATLGFAAATFGLIAAVMTARTEKLKGKLALMSRDVEALRKFAADVFSITYAPSDMFVLGPRAHGKTSLVTAVTQQWQSIRGMPPTPTHFQHFCWESPTYAESMFTDTDIGQQRPLRTYACLNIYDYAGEDQSISVALNAIAKSDRFLIVFVMSCEETPLVQSATYFNLTTLKAMRKALADAQSHPLTAMVLFTKQDASEFGAHADPTDIPATLEGRHQRALENIETIFGETAKFMVSAETGFGLSLAFRHALGHVVNEQGLSLH